MNKMAPSTEIRAFALWLVNNVPLGRLGPRVLAFALNAKYRRIK